jgi:fluoroquinolone transport system ATP-binding protein
MMGDINTLTKKVACPHCKYIIEISIKPGETIEITCSKCNTTGIYSFPKEKIEEEIKDESSIIHVNHIEFTYPKSNKKAVNDVSFEIKKGEIFGLLGPNGAGKTTTQKVIIGLLKQYNGYVELLGKNLKEWKAEIYNRIGVGFELPNHYQKLTALENLQLFASFYRGKKTPPMDLLKMVELEKDANQRVATFSKGMKSKLNFARSLLNDPEILFLDEPTTGLDPVGRRLIKNIILQKRKEGKAIFLTTHNMIDADELCDIVAFIVDGKIILIENPKELKIRHGKKIVKVEYLKNNELLSQQFDLKNLADNKNFLNLLKTDTVQTIHTAEATLDDIFIKATGRKLR